MTRARELANFADDTAGLETLTVSDVTDLSVSASNINSATNQMTHSGTDLNVHSNLFVVDKTNSKVGIGTSSPQGKLNIVPGNAVEGVRVSGTNNTLGLSLAYTDAGNTHSYIYNKYSGNDDSDMILGFGSSYGSGTVMTLKKSGNVGIGLGSTSPTARVHLSGTGTGGNASFHNYNTSSATFIHNQWNLASNMTANQTNVIFVGREPNTKNSGWIGYKWVGNASNDNTLSFGHWGADHLMNLRANGNLGIGTASPDNPLEVVGADNGIKITSASANRPHLRFECGTDEKMVLSANTAYGAIGDSSDTNRYMVFKDSKVGIGTTSPNTGTRVHIKNTDDTRGLYIENTDSSSYAEVHLKASREFRIGTGNSSSDVQARDRFYIYDATANAHRFTLDASGKVGIGTSSPDATILTGKTTGSTNS